MDTVKSSNSSNAPEVSNVMAPEETALGEKCDRQRQENNEPDADAPDGFVAVASTGQRRAQEKHRSNTIGYQKKKQRTTVDFSTVSKGTGVKSRGALKQVLFNQGTNDKNGTVEERLGGVQGQVDVLKQLLDSFSVPADLRWTWGEGGTERTLEKSWTEIVHSHESMSKTQRLQQEALWELLNTELTYINKLTIAKDLVLAALSHCHGNGFLQEVSPTMLFSDLPSILDAHRLFWHHVMYPMLQEVRLTGQPFDPMKLEPGCLQFHERFPAYFDYCFEGDRNVELTRKQLETNPQFYTYVMWVENHPQCGRMRLGDMQAKPHQRITKYPLLLKAVQKTTEDLPTKIALDRMLNSVNNFVQSINDYLQLKADELALSVIAQRIEGYKIEGLSEEVDKHVREICCFDLTSPVSGVGPNVIRKQILEETLKVKRRKDTKELVVLLFTDVLLMTKTQKKSDKLKVVRPPLPVERIHCIEVKDGYSFVLVEVGDLGCPVSVNFLSTPSPDSCASWVSALRETQEALQTLKINEKNEILKNTPTIPDKNADFQSASYSDIDPEEMVQQIYPTSQSDSDSDPADSERSTISKSDPQTLMDVEQSEVQQMPDYRSSPFTEPNDQSQSDYEEVVGRIDSAGLNAEQARSRNNSKQWEDEEATLKKIQERRVTWTQKQQTASNSNGVTQQELPKRNNLNGPAGHVNDTIQPLITTSAHISSLETGEPMHLDPNGDSQGSGRNSLCSQQEDDEDSLTESKRFSRKLKSPRIQRRRPNNAMHDSIANSNRSQKNKPQDSHRVLKLGSLKNNPSTLWYVPEKRSPTQEMHSEPEQTPEGKRKLKLIKLKTQRSASIPEISIPQSSILPSQVASSSLLTAPNPQPPTSPLQSVLQRAKEREKERGLVRRIVKEKQKTFSIQNSPTFSASPTLLASEGEREPESVHVCSMMSAHGWREGNVDESEDEMKERTDSMQIGRQHITQ
ncbi:pleckstrin homology domain-containing family G member 6 isoform X2 [Danio aesculapii]|uniref:pleckstrin homology domain-containing family G member 6 isoform X2 n=1 Tax=Danio aesculapii TaxID=1142201 RepID=UPI0024C0D6CB|nr:pleckstrin homology domain-containing family G member 6 isoform X2 [Danio aesculapii]